VHCTHNTESFNEHIHSHLLNRLPTGGLSDGLACLDVARHDAQLAVLETRITAANKKNVMPARQEHMNSNRKSGAVCSQSSFAERPNDPRRQTASLLPWQEA
jgi:hypothetical protein